jgi:D-inositol-3-phosphate glycosyltransferase
VALDRVREDPPLGAGFPFKRPRSCRCKSSSTMGYGYMRQNRTASPQPEGQQRRARQAHGPDPANGDRGDQARVAVLSVHTSPGDQPGTGDSGGMNVYIRSVAERLAEQGIAVDIYTRCRGQGGPEVEEIGPRSRLIRVQAGPCAPVDKEDLPGLLPAFLGGVLERAADEHGAHRHSPYDVVHSHYWLSGWVGSRAKEIWGAPLVASFHTLGKVKNAARLDGDPPEPPVRLQGEQRVVKGADRILAPTQVEAEDLVSLYGADPKRIRVVAPGVDRSIFAPRPKGEARARLGLAGKRLILFVGRLQPFKGPSVAVRALAKAVARQPELTRDVVLALVGGPSGRGWAGDEVVHLKEVASELGVEDRVMVLPPQPHERLVDFYSAAEAVLVPSRSESFGLVALEAQACGTPVVGTARGGLSFVVKDGETGFLVEDHDPSTYADRIIAVLGDPKLAARLARQAVRNAGSFSWDATASGIREVYRELLARPGA